MAPRDTASVCGRCSGTYPECSVCPSATASADEFDATQPIASGIWCAHRHRGARIGHPRRRTLRPQARGRTKGKDGPEGCRQDDTLRWAAHIILPATFFPLLAAGFTSIVIVDLDSCLAASRGSKGPTGHIGAGSDERCEPVVVARRGTWPGGGSSHLGLVPRGGETGKVRPRRFPAPVRRSSPEVGACRRRTLPFRGVPRQPSRLEFWDHPR